jgi:hypothetical protein
MLCRLHRSLLLLDLRAPPTEIVGPNREVEFDESALTLALSFSVSPREKTPWGDSHDGTFPDMQEGTYLDLCHWPTSRGERKRLGYQTTTYSRTFYLSQSPPWP